MIRIGNASGFYGDRFTAWQEMLTGGPLDVLTGDYLAELTMMILGRDRMGDPATGYARTFLRQMEISLGTAVERGVRIVTNAGGLNPVGLADAVRTLAARVGLPVAVGVVTGDDLTGRAAELGLGEPLVANAYLGAFGIARCLAAGADVVVTGRVTDAALAVGPAIHAYGWTPDDHDQLAGATVAGHIIECGAQATGGNYSFFTELPDGGRYPGFPIAEIAADGSATITKHPGTGGAVTVGTVTAQLLYEIGGPRYLGPDVVARLDTVRLAPDGPDRVRVFGVRGEPPPPTLKVGVGTLGGFRSSMTFVLTGLDIEEKAALVQRQLGDGLEFDLARTDRPDAPTIETASALLHVHETRAQPGRRLARAAVELALASYPGCTLTAPPRDATPYGSFRAAEVAQAAVEHTVLLPDGTRATVPPPARTAVPVAVPVDRPPPPADGPTVPGPLGRLAGARSGDKGGDANVGLWVRDPRHFGWLDGYLTVERLRALLPDTAGHPIERYAYPGLSALNFVIRGLLGDGVAASTRFDPQAKALGEWLRSRIVDLPADRA